METNIISPATDRFSWNRVRMVGRYYYPSLRRQLIIYPLVSVATIIISALFNHYKINMFLPGTLTLILSFMLYWGPVVFTSHSCRELEVSLPAKRSEKATFILLYTFIAIPLLAYGPYYIGEFLAGNPFLSEVTEKYAQVKGNFKIAIYIASIIQMVMPMSVCLFAVMASKTSRVTKGIGFSVLSLIGLSIITGLITVLHMINLPKDQLMALDGESPEAIIDMMGGLTDTFFTVSAIGAIVTATMICLTVRAINRIQV